MQAKKNITKSKIISYMLNNEETSKVDISKQLNLSMPTVLTNVNELIANGLIIEIGEYESTGGRKAKSLGINPEYGYAMGIDITANHIGMVLINLAGEIEKQQRKRIKFAADAAYYNLLSEEIEEFLSDIGYREKIMGCGVSLPGIINRKENLLVKSHALHLENYSLSFIENAIPFPVYFENDANGAMLAENPRKYTNAVYLSLNHTLGGAFCMNGTLFSGQNQKAGEFGHIILVPEGKNCYCGKKGCADAYCAASALTSHQAETMDSFMERVEKKESEAKQAWNEYLKYLAILISNLRMAYDVDIILGGEVGGYLPKYMTELGELVMQYNLFDRDLLYLKNCTYRREASAVGVAKHFFLKFVDEI